MLIFVKGPALDRIERGLKTATVRPWKRCSLRRGATLLFNGRVSTRLTRVVCCTLETMTVADARAAGYPSRAAFLRAYRALYPLAPADAPCVVLHFTSPRRVRA
jgi:hypothetical protein